MRLSLRKTFQRQTREEKYRDRAANMSDAAVAKAYVDLSVKADVLEKLSREYSQAFTPHPLPREYLPRYPDLNWDFESDEYQVQRLLKKAKIWVEVLHQAVVTRNIETDSVTVATPRRPPLVNKRADFSPYINAFPPRT